MDAAVLLLQGLPENFFPNRIIKPRVELGETGMLVN